MKLEKAIAIDFATSRNTCSLCIVLEFYVKVVPVYEPLFCNLTEPHFLQFRHTPSLYPPTIRFKKLVKGE